MGILDGFRRRRTGGGPSGVRARLEGAMAKRRLRGWQPPLENINSLVASGGPRLLARARELVVTNGYAGNACEAFAANLVGDGIKPSSLIEDAVVRDRVQRLWLAWTDEADADGLTDFYGLQGMVAREMFVAGECFVRLRPAPRRGRPAGAAAAAAPAVGDAAVREDRGPRRRPAHPLRHRVRRDRPPARLPLPPPASRRQHRPRSCHPGDGAGAGKRGAARLPADRRRPDPGPAARGAGDGAAVPARPVRRRRARPEEDRGDVRGLHHQDSARGGAARRDGGRRGRQRHREPRARHPAGALARRGRDVLVTRRMSAAATRRSSTGRCSRSRPRSGCRTISSPATPPGRTTRACAPGSSSSAAGSSSCSTG